jgi:hypothetical protein
VRSSRRKTKSADASLSTEAVGANKIRQRRSTEAVGAKQNPPSGGCLTELGVSGHRRLSVGGAITASGTGRIMKQPAPAKRLADAPPPWASGGRKPTPVASTEAVGTDEGCRYAARRLGKRQVSSRKKLPRSATQNIVLTG